MYWEKKKKQCLKEGGSEIGGNRGRLGLKGRNKKVTRKDRSHGVIVVTQGDPKKMF